MSYDEILQSFTDAKSMDELTMRVDIWSLAIDLGMTSYTDKQEELLAIALTATCESLKTIH